MTLRDTVAHNIRMLRISKGNSQHALAKRAGISVSYVSMLERAQRSPPLPQLETLAKALGVTPAFLCQELAVTPARKAKRANR